MTPLQAYAAAIAELARCRQAVRDAAAAGEAEAAAIRQEALEAAQAACDQARAEAGQGG